MYILLSIHPTQPTVPLKNSRMRLGWRNARQADVVQPDLALVHKQDADLTQCVVRDGTSHLQPCPRRGQRKRPASPTTTPTPQSQFARTQPESRAESEPLNPDLLPKQVTTSTWSPATAPIASTAAAYVVLATRREPRKEDTPASKTVALVAPAGFVTRTE